MQLRSIALERQMSRNHVVFPDRLHMHTCLTDFLLEKKKAQDEHDNIPFIQDITIVCTHICAIMTIKVVVYIPDLY